MGLFKSAHHPAKTDPAERDLSLSLPPPAPPRKKHPQPTQNDFPLRLPHHQCAAPGADSLSSPHLRMNCADLAEDSCPGRISDHVLAPSRHASHASCHRGTQRPSISHTKRNPTCAPAMGQDYPLTRPSPGANRPIYPSFPALASRSLPEGRIPKSHESFFFPLCRSVLLGANPDSPNPVGGSPVGTTKQEPSYKVSNVSCKCSTVVCLCHRDRALICGV